MSLELGSLLHKAEQYKNVLNNTSIYRTAWHDTLKPSYRLRWKKLLLNPVSKQRSKPGQD